MPPAAMTTDSAATSNGIPSGSTTPFTPVTAPRVDHERIDAMAEAEFEQVPARMAEQAGRERPDQRLAGSPDEMETRNGVARLVQAALDPHRHRHELDAEPGEPVIDVGNAAFDISLGPGARPVRAPASQFAPGEPVLKSQFDAVLDPVAFLQRRAGEPQAAKGLLAEAAEVFLGVAVDQQHAPAAVEGLDRGGDASDSGAGDRDVGGMAVRKA